MIYSKNWNTNVTEYSCNDQCLEYCFPSEYFGRGGKQLEISKSGMTYGSRFKGKVEPVCPRNA